MSTNVTPKSVQRMLVRTAVIAGILAGTIFGYNWLRGQKGDLDLGTADTKGWVAAIQSKDGKDQLVVIKPDGKIVEAPGYTEGKTDRDPVWRPDGNRIVFSSDREEGAYNIFRWNLATEKVERRSIGKIGKSQPSFAPGDANGQNPLFVYGGTVWELDLKEGKGEKIVPPDTGNAAVDLNDESASASVGKFGEGAELKIRYAKYLKEKAGVIYIRRGESEESALFQANVEGLSEEEAKKKGAPISLAMAERIYLDTHPTKDMVAITIQGLRFSDKNVPKEYIKNGRLVLPYKNSVFLVDLATQNAIALAQTPDDKVAFGKIVFSPDGSRFALVLGTRIDGEFHGKAIFSASASEAGKTDGKPVYGDPAAEVNDPSWTADGKSIVFTRTEGSTRDVCQVDLSGTGFKNLTNGKGKFSSPVVSPQK